MEQCACGHRAFVERRTGKRDEQSPVVVERRKRDEPIPGTLEEPTSG